MLNTEKSIVTAHKLYFKNKLFKQSLRELQKNLQQCRSASSSATITNDESISSDSRTEVTEEWKRAKPFEDIPTLSTLTLLRNFLPGGKYAKLDLSQLMLAFKEDMGSISMLKGLFGKPNGVITHNPHDFEKVFRNEGVWPYRPGMETLFHHRSVHRADFFRGVEGLVGIQGEKWSTFRSTVNPVLMQPKNVRLYFQKMSEVNKEFIERIRHIRDTQTHEVPDTFEEEINRWTLESVSVVALDNQLGLITKNRDDPVAKHLFKSVTDLFTYSFKMELTPSLWKYYKTPTYKKMMKCLDDITDITKAYVDEAITRIEAENKNRVAEKSENEKSVLEKLIKMDRKIATVMAMDMLIAGVDTTSSSFTGLLLCLAKNPEKQAKLREEVMTLLPKKDSEFNETTFKNMPYLRACLKESLRVYPLTVGNARIPVNDVVLSGYKVPKGTQVTMISTSLLNDDTHYPRAKEYLPERWLRSSKDTENSGECPHALKASSPFIYLPFGFGPRSCIGRRIVEMELEMGIARLIRNFHVEFNHPTDNAFRSIMINVPNIPLKFKFTDVSN